MPWGGPPGFTLVFALGEIRRHTRCGISGADLRDRLKKVAPPAHGCHCTCSVPDAISSMQSSFCVFLRNLVAQDFEPETCKCPGICPGKLPTFALVSVSLPWGIPWFCPGGYQGEYQGKCRSAGALIRPCRSLGYLFFPQVAPPG